MKYLITFTFVMFGSLVTTLLGVSAPKDLSLDKLDVSPDMISSEGKSRIKQHVQIIRDNIANTLTNIQSTKKNVLVIEAEIHDLEELGKEHQNLKTRYLDFLSKANIEFIKNNKALNEIDQFQKKLSKLNNVNQNKARSGEIVEAQTEKMERENWKRESEEKVVRIRELLVGVEKNIQSIEGRKAPLKEQFITWSLRQTEYTKIMEQLTEKKKNAERFITSQNK